MTSDVLQRRVARETLGEMRISILALAIGLAACQRDGSGEQLPPRRLIETEGAPEVLSAADARRPVDDPTAGPRVSLRRIQVRALARSRLEGSAPALLRALRDADPEVRRWASFGLAELGSATALEPLTAAWAFEDEAPVRASNLLDLGMLPFNPNGAAAEGEAGNADGAGGFCEAVGLAVDRGRSLAPRTATRLAELATGPRATERRLACLRTLSRVQTSLAPPFHDLLYKLADGGGPRERRLALRVLARSGAAVRPVLKKLAGSGEWTDAPAAFELLAARGAVASVLGALQKRLRHALERPQTFASAELHALLAGFESAAELHDRERVQVWAASAMRQLAPVSSDALIKYGQALSHCAAARLADIAGGWPSRLRACGRGLIRDTWIAAAEVDVLLRVVAPDARRAAHLRRIYERASPAVRERVLLAVASLQQAVREELLLRGLEDDNPLVATRALELLGQLPPQADAVAKLPDMHSKLLEAGSASGLIAWLGYAAAADFDGKSELVATLCRHLNPSVRAAVDAIERCGQTAPLASDGLPPQRFPVQAEPVHVSFELLRGEFVVELLPDTAPATVVRLLERVRRGDYGETAVSRVLPGSIVELSPGTQAPVEHRSERSPRRVARGDVVLLETQFDETSGVIFVALDDQPQLRGQHTTVGRIASGLDVLAAMLPGERIKRVSVN